MVESVLNRWVWLIAILFTAVVTLPLLVVWVVLNLPPDLRLIATICIIVAWGLVSGYKDWIIAKREKGSRARV